MGTNGCANCIVLDPCGGHPLPIVRQIGCANFSSTKAPTDTDDMNPLFEEQFWRLWDDVGGLMDYSIDGILPVDPVGLPHYIPLLQGRQLQPPRCLKLKHVALPLFDVIGQPKGRPYGLKFPDADSLRRAYNLDNNTRILLVGVDHDPPLETFWAKHRSTSVRESLAKLGLDTTVPNFSFFTCVPRFQILRNRKRILLSAERLSKAGVRLALHLNANTVGDWNFWLQFLAEHTEVTTVAVEFQTGARAEKQTGEEIIDRLGSLLSRLGRPLHCILVGAGRFYKDALSRGWSFTLVDSAPYMHAIAREVLMKDSSGRVVWKKLPTRQDAPLYSLFEANLKLYERSLCPTSRGARGRRKPEDRNQVSLLY